MKHSHSRRSLALVAALAVSVPAFAAMTFEPDYAGYQWTQIYSSGGQGAVDLAVLPSGNLLVALKTGMVVCISPTGTFRRNALDIRSTVSSFGDGGLTAILLDPEFPTEPWLYVFYAVDTNPGSPDTATSRYGRISRFQLSPGTNYESLVAGTEQILIGETWSEGVLLEGPFHANDCMDWGDDHTLLFSAGDSSSSYGYAATGAGSFGPGKFDSSLDIGSLRAQSMACYNGKISRIDRETGLGLPSNPFYTGNPDDPQSRVWVRGLRNPWRFSVLRGTGAHDASLGLPGALWIGDVGLSTYEELNIATRDGGENFGWPFYEGPLTDQWPFIQATWAGPIQWPAPGSIAPYEVALPHPATSQPVDPPGIMDGYFADSITGGLFYDYKSAQGATTSPYSALIDDRYLFANWSDAAGGRIWSGRVDSFDQLVEVDLIASGSPTAGEGFVDIGYSPVSGAIFGLTYWRVYRLDYNPTNAPPFAAIAATPIDGDVPLNVTLDASASYSPSGGALAYEWKLDGATVGSTSTPTFATTLADDRNYEATVVVTNQASLTAEASTTIYAGNTPPTPTIVYPRAYWTYPDDGTPMAIPVSGYIDDPDAVSPPTATWRLALRHNTHRHDLLEFPGTSGSFTLTADEDNTHYLFEFFATDDRGQTTMASVEMFEGFGQIDAAADSSWEMYE